MRPPVVNIFQSSLVTHVRDVQTIGADFGAADCESTGWASSSATTVRHWASTEHGSMESQRSRSKSLGFSRRKATGIEISPRLAIPFGFTEALEVALPDLDVAPALAVQEPPSLYLFGPDYLNVPPDREEYRCAYEANPWGDDLVAEYACGRSLYERHRGWEFTQTVWVSSATR